MNHTIDKNGKSVIAIGAPGSLARKKCEGLVCYQCEAEISKDDAEYENFIGEYICQSCYESGFDISLEDL